MNRIRIFLLIIISLLATTIIAGDGRRSGFIKGISLGVAPLMNSSVTIETGEQKYRGFGPTAGFMLGYGFDDRNMLVVEGQLSLSISSDKHLQGTLHSLVWYHYWGKLPKSIFTAVGISRKLHYVDRVMWQGGTALLIGGGWQFKEHWQVGSYLQVGDYDGVKNKYKQTTITMLVSHVIY